MKTGTFFTFFIFIALGSCCLAGNVFPAVSTAYPITARVLAINEKTYDDLTVSGRQHKQKGVTQVFLKLKVMSASRPIRRSRDISGRTIFKKGQIIDAYAYKDFDFMGSKQLYTEDVITAEIIALPIGEESFSYKLSRIRKR